MELKLQNRPPRSPLSPASRSTLGYLERKPPPPAPASSRPRASSRTYLDKVSLPRKFPRAPLPLEPKLPLQPLPPSTSRRRASTASPPLLPYVRLCPCRDTLADSPSRSLPLLELPRLPTPSLPTRSELSRTRLEKFTMRSSLSSALDPARSPLSLSVHLSLRRATGS